MVYQVYLLFGLPVNEAYLGFTFCGTLCSYNFHWFLTPASFGGTYKARWSVSHKWLHAALFLGALGAAFYFGFQLLTFWPWLVATAFFTFMYSAPMIPLVATRALQKIAVGKTLFLALTWTQVTVLLPLIIAGATLHQSELLYLAIRFFLIYGVCIVFDYRDREQDRRQGIRSMVTILEPLGVHWYFAAVMTAFFLCTLAFLTQGMPLQKVLALLAPGLLLSVLYRYSLRQNGDYLYYFVLDGLMALSLPLLVLL